MASSPFTMTLAMASLEPMWLVATHLYVPLSLSFTWALRSFPSLVVSVPAGRFPLPTRVHTNRTLTLTALSTHSPLPSACMPHCSHVHWLHYRCIGQSLGAPRWSVSEHHQPLCVYMVTVLIAWTR